MLSLSISDLSNTSNLTSDFYGYDSQEQQARVVNHNGRYYSLLYTGGYDATNEHDFRND